MRRKVNEKEFLNYTKWVKNKMHKNWKIVKYEEKFKCIRINKLWEMRKNKTHKTW